MVGVWMPPVGAQVTMTGLGMSASDADERAVGGKDEAVEVVDAVLGQARARRVVDDATLVERWRTHASLDTLDDADVLLLQDLVDVAHGLHLGIPKLGRVEVEVPGLHRAVHA